MWSNFLRLVGDGITVGALPDAVGLQKPRVLSTLGGMERWRYVFVGPAGARRPPTEKRDGYGSARGLDSTWVVRPTTAGRRAAAIWPSLFDEIEGRWKERFGSDEIDDLRGALQPIVGKVDMELPEYLPIVGGSNGMTADLPPRARIAASAGEGDESRAGLCALVSKTLLAYTVEFEAESQLSLPLSANFLRVLDESGVLVRDLPMHAGVSKEATAMAMTFLIRSGHVAVDGSSSSTKRARVTPMGQEHRNDYERLHAVLEQRWGTRYGDGGLRRLRSWLMRVLERREGLARALEPYADGWRATKAYVAHTRALIDDPIARLPHYPLVLHRGGWPDGS